MKKYINYKIEEFDSNKKLTLNEVNDILFNKIIKNNKIPKIILSLDFLKKYNYFDLIESIKFYTNFLNNETKISIRIFCLKNKIYSYPICVCGKEIKKFNGTFSNGNFNKYCSQSCARKNTDPFKNFSKIEREKIYQKIIKRRKENGSYQYSDKKLENIRKANKNPKKWEKFRKTCFEKYGVENPGVLGAYSSKAAKNFILKFINFYQYNIDLCYFNDKNLNKKEFFQIIDMPRFFKKVYCCYDLVIFNSYEDYYFKNVDGIKLILEYNGPWHYKIEKLTDDELNEPSTPYLNNTSKKKMTKFESIEFDNYKLNHALTLTKNVYVFWEKYGTLERFK